MRKTLTVVIEAKNRDENKVFVLTEFPAMQGEKWAIRALIAIAKSNPQIPEDFVELGWQGLAMFTMEALSGVDFSEAEPLLDEMLTCVKVMPDPHKPNITRPLGLGGAEDIEEFSTLLKLRKEIFTLHADFFVKGADSASTPSEPAGTSTPNTPTSRRPLGRLSQQAKRR